MIINENLVIQFEPVVGQAKRQLFCYFSDKQNAPYFSSDIIGSAVIEIYGKKRLLWKSSVNIGSKKPLETMELPAGVLKIFHLWTEGTSIPDIATYWIATLNGKPVSMRYRDMWRSGDYIYPQWVDSLKSRYTEVVAT